MGNKLVIGSSGQIGVELIEQLSKIHGPNNVIASDIKPRLKNKIKGVEYLTLDVLDKPKLLEVIKKYKIKYQNVLGHSDISPSRKKDPGEKFPWKELAKEKLCLWHELNYSSIKKFRRRNLNLSEEKFFLKNKLYYLKHNSLQNHNFPKILFDFF